jgi:hypothetical protein
VLCQQLQRALHTADSAEAHLLIAVLLLRLLVRLHVQGVHRLKSTSLLIQSSNTASTEYLHPSSQLGRIVVQLRQTIASQLLLFLNFAQLLLLQGLGSRLLRPVCRCSTGQNQSQSLLEEGQEGCILHDGIMAPWPDCIRNHRSSISTPVSRIACISGRCIDESSEECPTNLETISRLTSLSSSDVTRCASLRNSRYARMALRVPCAPEKHVNHL